MEGSRWLRRVMVVVVLATAVGGFLFWRSKTQPPPPARYVTAEVSKGMRVVDIGITDGINTELKTDLGAVKVVTDETDDAADAKKQLRRMF